MNTKDKIEYLKWLEPLIGFIAITANMIFLLTVEEPILQSGYITMAAYVSVTGFPFAAFLYAKRVRKSLETLIGQQKLTQYMDSMEDYKRIYD